MVIESMKLLGRFNFASLAFPKIGSFQWQRSTTFAVYVLLWTWIENKRDNIAFFRTEHYEPPAPTYTASQLASIEAIKLALAFVWYFWKRRRSRSTRVDSPRGRGWVQHRLEDDEQTLSDFRDGSGANGWLGSYARTPEARVSFGSFWFIGLVLLASALHASYNFLTSRAYAYFDSPTIYLDVSLATLISLLALHTFLSRFFTPVQWQAALLQLCGLYIIKSTLTIDTSKSTYPILVSHAIFQAFTLVLTDYIYKLHNQSFTQISIPIFSSTLIMHLLILIFRRHTQTSFLVDFPASSKHGFSPTEHILGVSKNPNVMMPLLAKAVLDVIGLWIICENDAPTLTTLTALGASLFLSTKSAQAGVFLGNTGIVLGCVVAVFGCSAYLWRRYSEAEEWEGKDIPHPRSHRLPSFLLLLLLLLYTLTTFSPPSPLTLSHSFDPSLQTLLEKYSQPHCVRPPLHSPWNPDYRYRNRNEGKRLHDFDDVLLVVFFSHARYDANLDYYREVYGEWFPNILFVGPASREDKGFKHSYDVLVDSYFSDEDLSDPNNYKMAGRMAHHMLYTALSQHPCYKGYLWAPFDTLLNVPRLIQFDQEKFWYHSFKGEIVWNPALNNTNTTYSGGKHGVEEDGNTATGMNPSQSMSEGSAKNESDLGLELAMDGNYNKSRHAPPVQISPDPEVDWTVGWRGWGPDWWWGSPHVGLKTCYPAFLQTPQHMRDRMSHLFTNGTTRLIGGSADTLYIPGRYRDVFKDTLGLFLETECFLEIAVPTVVHLVVGEFGEFGEGGFGEDDGDGEGPRNTGNDTGLFQFTDTGIQFVDHWWIWQHPFNATFVRQKWAEGYEVDTMHTFHWGDKDDEGDGKWRGRPENILDLRILMRESADRQGVRWI